MSAHESSSGRFGHFFSSMPMWLPSTKLVLTGNGFIIPLGILERSLGAARKNWPHLQPGEIKMHSNFTCFRSDGIIIMLNRNCYGNRFWVITQLCARFQLFWDSSCMVSVAILRSKNGEVILWSLFNFQRIPVASCLSDYIFIGIHYYVSEIGEDRS